MSYKPYIPSLIAGNQSSEVGPKTTHIAVQALPLPNRSFFLPSELIDGTAYDGDLVLPDLREAILLSLRTLGLIPDGITDEQLVVFSNGSEDRGFLIAFAPNGPPNVPGPVQGRLVYQLAEADLTRTRAEVSHDSIFNADTYNGPSLDNPIPMPDQPRIIPSSTPHPDPDDAVIDVTKNIQGGPVMDMASQLSHAARSNFLQSRIIPASLSFSEFPPALLDSYLFPMGHLSQPDPEWEVLGTWPVTNTPEAFAFQQAVQPGCVYVISNLDLPTVMALRPRPSLITLVHVGTSPTFAVVRTPYSADGTPIPSTDSADYVQLNSPIAIENLAINFGFDLKHSLGDALSFLESKIGTSIPDPGYFGKL